MIIKAGNQTVFQQNGFLYTNAFMKNLLEYSNKYANTSGVYFWHLDTDATTANTNKGFEARKAKTDNNKDVKVIIPLNR